MNEFQGDDAEHEKKFTELGDCNKRIAYLDWPGGYQYTEWINPRQTTARLISSTIRYNTRAMSQAFQTISVLLMTRHFSHDIIKQIKQNKKRNIYTLSIVYIFAGQLLLTVFQHSFVYINASHTRNTWFPVIFNVSSSSLMSPILFSDRRGRSLKSPINFSSRLRNYINIYFFTNILQKNVSALII